jgi:hypothetical protein
MSNLPHPLGDSSAGDLFYPGSPTVIAADIPGSGGSRAVEFGEDGLSSAVNRGLYALGKNEEYIQARMEAEIARPELLTFTPAGGSGGNYTFSVDVWCGDTAYTPEDQNVRNGLISVLDLNYNDLTDPVSGDQIVVKEILDAPAGASQVGAGFVSNPYITFRRMNPITGALGADYTIPDSVKVWLAFGQKAILDDLVGASSSNLIDSWFRGFTRSIGEIHAGSFVKDGSRKATGDFDMNSNNLVNVDKVESVNTGPLLLRGIGAGGHVDFFSDDLVRFRDQYNVSYVPINDGDAGVYGSKTSLLTSLNSDTRVLEGAMGNRCLDRVGSFTFTGGTGQIDWPELNLCIDGEYVNIATGNIIATNNGSATFVLVVTSGGSVAERAADSVLPTDIPLTSHTWNGSAFLKSVDIRWAWNGQLRHQEIRVGDANTCDFASTEFDKAVELANRLADAAENGGEAHMPIIRILGSAVVPSASPYNVTIDRPMKIVGSGPQHSLLYSDENNGDTVNMIECGGNQVVVEDLKIVHSGDVQASTLGCFKNAGSNSIFRNLVFDKDGGTFDVGFSNPFIWDSAAQNVLIENIRTVGTQHCFVNGSDAAFTTAYLTESVIRDCWPTWEGSPSCGIVANGDGNVISNVEMPTGLDDYGIVSGNDTLIDRFKVRMTGAGGATPAGVYYVPVATPAYHQGTFIRDSYFLRIAGAGVLSSAINNASTVLEVKVRNCIFNQVDKPIDFSAVVSVHGSSSTIVDGCRFTDTSEFVASYQNVVKNKFINNVCDDTGGDGIYVQAFAGCDIINNNFEGYGSSGGQGHVIAVDLGTASVKINDNVIGNIGAPAASIQVDVWRKCSISGNTLVGSANAATGISCNSWLFLVVDLPAAVNTKITNNFFSGHGATAVELNRGTAVAAVYGGQMLQGNEFSSIPAGGICVNVDDVSNVDVSNNKFIDSEGAGVRVLSTLAGAGAESSIRGNRFSNVTGNTDHTPYGYAIVGVHGSNAINAVVNDNRFVSCGMTSGAASMVQSIINVDAGDGCQVNDNYINGLRGISAASDQSDVSYGIYLGSGDCDRAQVHGNYVINNFADTGKVADQMWGIRIEGTGQTVVGNRVHFYGTQSDTNKTDILYGISSGSSDDKVLVSSNYSDVTATIAGITIQRSFLCNNDFSVMLGNWGDGGDMDFTATNVVIVGNNHLTGGALVHTTGASVRPDTQTNYDALATLPIADINQL